MSRCDLFPSAETLLSDIREYPYPVPSFERPRLIAQIRY